MPSDRSHKSSHSFLPYPNRASRSSSPSHQSHRSRTVGGIEAPYIPLLPLRPHEPSLEDHTENISPPSRIQTNCVPIANATQPQHLAPANAVIQQQSSLPDWARSYPVASQLFNYDYSIGAQHRQPYTVYAPAPRQSQFEHITRTGTRFTQPYSTSHAVSLPSQRPLQQQDGIFHQPHDFVISDSVLINNNLNSDNFMSLFLKETIPRAEFDSSDPNMPLRCHRGTRLKIIKRCQDFVLTCRGSQKLRWVVGAAGVGKSAIMQSVARELSDLSDVVVGATIFFSINGRQDGTKAITTIAYQLAVKLDPYRLFVQREVTRDPTLLHKSLPTQFKKFIVEPFVYHQLLPPCFRLLIIIDGLDECSNQLMQQELLGLISFFCIAYPSSPLIWLVASRPEPHITSFFSQSKVTGSFEKEEITVVSDDAYEDVKRYLRDSLREVQLSSVALRHLSQWPSNDELFKITNASGGLFAYASTVVRYISNLTYGDPASQLDDVLKFIDGAADSNLSGEDHPMAQLDALYAHIMSKIPAKAMANTRNLLLLYAGGPILDDKPFRLNCNLLGMTKNAAYGATHYIRSVAIVPEPAQAAEIDLQFFHKSFRDYLQDFERSGFSRDIWSEADQLRDQLALNIIRKAPDGVHSASKGNFVSSWSGMFKNRPGTRDSISVSWPGAGEDDDYEMRFDMFDVAVDLLLDGLIRRVPAFRNLFCMHVLTTCFEEVTEFFPIYAVRDFPFQEPWRSEFLEHGILKQVPLETIDYDEITADRYIRLRIRGPTAKAWNKSCLHERKGYSRDWSTKFEADSYSRDSYGRKYPCSYCFQRFNDHFDMLSPDHLVTVLELTSEHRVVELRFVDPEDGVSEWIYNFHTGWIFPDLIDKHDEASDGEYQSDDDV